MQRRNFLQHAAVTTAGLWLPNAIVWAGDKQKTASQTMGPFYPIPAIDKQKYFDRDLTRLSSDSPVAEGEIIGIRGTVVDIDGKPLEKTIVEIWQACNSGRYNHPQDRNDRPADPNFQYWARMETDAEGRFSYKTILPGKYPGRTPHIHYRVLSADHPELVTQMYFEVNQELNLRDGIYMGVSKEERQALTVGFEKETLDTSDKSSETIPVGKFELVLGPSGNKKVTAPMP